MDAPQCGCAKAERCRAIIDCAIDFPIFLKHYGKMTDIFHYKKSQANTTQCSTCLFLSFCMCENLIFPRVGSGIRIMQLRVLARSDPDLQEPCTRVFLSIRKILVMKHVLNTCCVSDQHIFCAPDTVPLITGRI